MAPYIALLILLIVVILFSVYTGTDGFATTFSETTTFQEFMNTLKTALQKHKELKQKLDSSTEFDDTLSLPKLKELGFDRAPSERPFSKGLSSQMETDGILLTGIVNMFQTALNSGTIKNTDLLKELRSKNIQVDSVAKAVPRIESVLEKRLAYITSKAVSPSAALTTDASGNAVNTLNINDLFGAVTGVQQALKASKLSNKHKQEPQYEQAPETTMGSTKEMEDRIAKSVATQLKDSLLVKRATENIVDDMACPYSPYSNATAQGQEYRQVKPAPSSAPDMSEYIRKDSIPCWNCSLP